MRRVTSSRTLIFFRLLACASVLSLALPAPAPEAKPSKKEAIAKKKKRVVKKQSGGGYRPPYADIVVDAKTGKVLASDHADELRHPASLTKVMTLYILFDELDAGRLTLQTPLKVSAEAARQVPSKLGLQAGQTIPVEAAIKALVTKSANDVAVTIAENIAGSEPAFATRMTRKARALGMNSTVYRNASGLPNDDQITTARDLALLGRAIQDNHPDYYDYFSTRTFSWKGQTYGNHNKLLGSVRGVDGIKTGYIRASGFNLLTSAQDDGRHIVAVVLGGRSGKTRDAQMRKLVAENLPKASAGKRTAPLIAENAAPAMSARASTAVAAVMPPLPAPRPALETAAKPLPIKSPADLPDPVLAAVAASAPQPVEEPAPAPAAAAPAAPAVAADGSRNPTMTPDAIVRRIDIANRIAMETTTPGGDMRWVVGAQPAPSSITSAYSGTTTPGSAPRAPAQQAIAAAISSQQPIVAAASTVAAPAVAQQPATLQARAAALAAPIATPAAQPVQQTAALPPIETASVISLTAQPAETPKPEPARVETALASAPPPPGWQIQIAATPDPAQARTLLDRVSGTIKSVDKTAEPYTEPVEKDGVTLYRVRYAGFSERSANAACKAVKKSSLSCFTLKN